jgi:phosphoribosylamine--glycine ligase
MRVLVIGGGGREHALAAAIVRSPRCAHLLCAPGNAGTAQLGENVAVDPTDLDGLVTVARDRGVDLTVVGPEAPLCAGVVDRFLVEGLRIFGPTAAAARIEGDKAYAKGLMKSACVPTAEGRVFRRYNEAYDYAAARDCALVVKASGLAAGKGVFVCEEPAEALVVLERLMVEDALGDAGRAVVIEERLKGEELSVFALVDDRTIYVLEAAQDYKRLGDRDTGPNTGGMGAYSPAPIATPAVLRHVEREVFLPIVDALRRDDAPYRGVLYAGLMLTPAGPKVLEFNCRFGDPEAQAVLPRMETDLLTVLDAVVDGRLAEQDIRFRPECAVTVVLASAGYPGAHAQGKPIDGLEGAEALDGVQVFHAGTGMVGSRVVTRGGRVLSVTGTGEDFAQARDRAYEGVARIRFDGAVWRTDIAARAVHAGATPARL